MAGAPGHQEGIRVHLAAADLPVLGIGGRRDPEMDMRVGGTGVAGVANITEQLARLHAECAAQATACFDSARVIPAAEAGRFTFAHDSHWNRDGHRRVGAALAEVLEREPALRRVRSARPP